MFLCLRPAVLSSHSLGPLMTERKSLGCTLCHSQNVNDAQERATHSLSPSRIFVLDGGRAHLYIRNRSAPVYFSCRAGLVTGQDASGRLSKSKLAPSLRYCTIYSTDLAEVLCTAKSFRPGLELEPKRLRTLAAASATCLNRLAWFCRVTVLLVPCSFRLLNSFA